MKCEERKKARAGRKRSRLSGLRVAAAAWMCAWAFALSATQPVHAFDFEKDTFAFANQLVWEYGYDADGHWVSHRRTPKPDYTLHCFVVARSARQFFDHARFDPSQPVAEEATYRRLIRQVIKISPRKVLPESEKLVIPGYADLREFSTAHEKLLKEQCGGAWQSYFQLGNWRMIFPFTRAHQARMAQQILSHLGRERPVVVHVLRFPQLSINHAVVVFAAQETASSIEFTTYDPNQPESPTTLTFDRATRTFTLPANAYFQGGKLNAYEIYWKWDY